jgi:hypothetical protein
MMGIITVASGRRFGGGGSSTRWGWTGGPCPTGVRGVGGDHSSVVTCSVVGGTGGEGGDTGSNVGGVDPGRTCSPLLRGFQGWPGRQ